MLNRLSTEQRIWAIALGLTNPLLDAFYLKGTRQTTSFMRVHTTIFKMRQMKEVALSLPLEIHPYSKRKEKNMMVWVKDLAEHKGI